MTFPLQPLEILVVNAIGRVRTEYLNGEEYLVAPVTMIVPNVLNGSRGPVLYSPQEVGRNHDGWNGMPILAGHPFNESGQPVSGRSPQVVARYGIGTVYGTTMDSNLKAEAWFHVANTRRVDGRIYDKLVRNEPIEMSTGLRAELVPPRAGQPNIHNGVAYTNEAINLRPDHLAVLMDAKGACGIKDGCGILINQQGQLIDNPPTGVQTMAFNRQEAISYLVTNCDCWKNPAPGDLAFLNSLSDAKLEAFEKMSKEEIARRVQQQQQTQPQQVVTGPAGTGATQPEGGQGNPHAPQQGTVQSSPLQGVAQPVPSQQSAQPVPQQQQVSPHTSPPQVQPQQATPQPPPAQTVTNQQGVLPMEQWLAVAPPQARNIWNNMVKAEEAERVRLADLLVTNANNPFSREYLLSLDIPQLNNLVKLAGAAIQNQGGNGQPGMINGMLIPGQQAAPTYQGVGQVAQPTIYNAEELSDVLPIPGFKGMGQKVS